MQSSRSLRTALVSWSFVTLLASCSSDEGGGAGTDAVADAGLSSDVLVFPDFGAQGADAPVGTASDASDGGETAAADVARDAPTSEDSASPVTDSGVADQPANDGGGGGGTDAGGGNDTLPPGDIAETQDLGPEPDTGALDNGAGEPDTAAPDTGAGEPDSVVSDCDNTFGEPNDREDDATPVAPVVPGAAGGFPLEAEICAGDVDWYGFELEAGTSASVVIDFDHDDGDIDLQAFAEVAGSGPVDSSETTADREVVVVGPFGVDTQATFEVFGYRGATNTYELSAYLYEDDAEVEVSVKGRVEYEDRRYDTEGFTGDLDLRPARGVLVEVVRTLDGAPLGEGVADSEGDFTFAVSLHPDLLYYVRALSETHYEGQRGRAVDRSGDEVLYAVVSDPFAPGADDPVEIDVLAERAEAIGGAMNIVDTTWELFDFISDYVESSAPRVTFRWERGRSFGCGSCYSNNVISLGGQLEDPDEYDDDIILHELGHYFSQHYADDDSSGGQHRDRQVNPRTAYAEGAAYVFAGVIRQTPYYVDNYIDDIRFTHYEDVTLNGESLDDFFGTDNGTLGGDLREEIVEGILWDAYDAFDAEEPFDTLEIGADGMMEIFIGYFGDGGAPNVGASGIDLADFLNALTCGEPNPESTVQPIVDDREFPWSVEDDAECSGKGGSLSTLGLVRQGDGLWLAADDERPGVLALQVEAEVGGVVTRGWVQCGAEACRIAEGVGDDDVVVVFGRSARGPVGGSWVGEGAQRRLLGGRPRLMPSPLGAVREYPSR